MTEEELKKIESYSVLFIAGKPTDTALLIAEVRRLQSALTKEKEGNKQ